MARKGDCLGIHCWPTNTVALERAEGCCGNFVGKTRLVMGEEGTVGHRTCIFSSGTCWEVSLQLEVTSLAFWIRHALELREEPQLRMGTED